MLARLSVSSACLLGLMACSGDPDTETTDDTAVSDVAEVSPQAHRYRRTWTSASTGTLSVRQTADGELIDVIIPEPAPTTEVPAGGQCGIVNADGVLLSCQPGTYCLSPGDGLPGTCQVAPRAPPSEG